MRTSGLIGVLALSLVASGCEKKLDSAKLKELIQSVLTSKGVGTADITCPDMPIKKDAVGACQVKVDGVTFETEVLQVDDAGKVNARTKGVYFPADMSAKLQERARANAPDATVDCGSAKIKVAHTGDKLTCVAKGPGGEQQVVALMKDEYGAVELMAPPTEPAKPPEPAAGEPAADKPPEGDKAHEGDKAEEHPAEPAAGDKPAEPAAGDKPAEPAH